MLKFDLIGSINLRRDDGEEIDQLLRQPKRLALLAYLAAPSPGTWHRRDSLLGVFWPGLDTAHGRTALRNALYVLRQTLGDGVVVTRGDEEVSIDPAMLATDLDAIWSAIRAQRGEDALALYRGELLTGLYPGDGEGFLEWLEGQRARLRAEVGRVGAARAEQLEREQKLSEALGVAKQVAEITPDDETAVRRVLRLHEAVGDRIGGLALYERFASWLEHEFSAEPSVETKVLAERLRQATGDAPRVKVKAADTPNAAPADHKATAPVRRKKWTVPPSAIVGAIVVVAMILTGSAIAVLMPSRSVEIGKSYPVTSDEGLQIEPDLSPDGRSVAYAKGGPGHIRIWVQRTDGGTPWPLTRDSTANEQVPRWSPQGDQILYLSRNHAWVSAANGGPARVVASGIDADRSVRSASWSPRGDSLAFVRGSSPSDSLMVKALDSPGARLVGTGRQLHSCVWSPDGHWISCVTGNWLAFTPGPLFGNRAPSGILMFPAKGGAAIPFTDSDHEYLSPSWAPDSHELWVLSNRDGPSGEVYAIPVGSEGKAAGNPVRVGLNAQWISRGDRRIAYSDYSRWSNVWALPIPPADARAPSRADDAWPVTAGRRIIEIAQVSRDGRWLVYDSNEHGNSDIYRMSLHDSLPVTEQLTDDPRAEFWGVISPDGKSLAYHMYVDGKRHLQLKRLADNVIEDPLPEPGDRGAARWSPEGNAIAAWAHETESGEVFVVRRGTDGKWRPPAWRLPDAQLPYWSPDGTSLAFVTLRGTVELMAADSGARRVLYAPRPGTNDPLATNVVWDAGRAYMWFIGNTPAGDGGIWVLPLGGGRPRQVVTLVTTRATTYGPVFDSDGKRLYFVLDERHGNVRYAELVKR